jgi:hypothetical protein
MSISITAMKAIKRLSKNELVAMVTSISNYAEGQKAQSIILLKMVEDLKAELAKLQPQEPSVEKQDV